MTRLAVAVALLTGFLTWATITRPLEPTVNVNIPESVTMYHHVTLTPTTPLEITVKGIPSLPPFSDIPSKIRVQIVPTPDVHIKVEGLE